MTDANPTRSAQAICDLGVKLGEDLMETVRRNLKIQMAGGMDPVECVGAIAVGTTLFNALVNESFAPSPEVRALADSLAKTFSAETIRRGRGRGRRDFDGNAG